MIFLRYESFREYIKLYRVISILITINLLLFAILSINGGSTNHMSLIKYGALYNHPNFIGEWWRLITAMFLHIGFGHLLFNSFALFLFGPYLERLLGKLKFTILYFAGGIAGNVFSMLLVASGPPYTVSAGASGAIYGLFGAYIFMSLFRKRYIDMQSSRTIVILLIFGIVSSVIYPQINILAHLGGFLGGFLVYSLLHKNK